MKDVLCNLQSAPAAAGSLLRLGRLKKLLQRRRGGKEEEEEEGEEEEERRRSSGVAD